MTTELLHIKMPPQKVSSTFIAYNFVDDRLAFVLIIIAIR